MRLCAAVGFLVLMSYGCSDPRCPANLVQVGNSCRCPEGTQKSGPTCVEVDGGAADEDGPGEDPMEAGTEPSETDGNALTDDGSVDASTRDADETLGCYVDRDKDGVGAGAAVSCSDALVISLGFALATVNGDCDDMDPARSPSRSDVCGDNIDNDCDGIVDDESNNACGGPCSLPLLHRPGDACDNGLLGACKRTGSYVCAGASVQCNAPMIAAGTEVCADSVDNDCDGAVDEPDAADALSWYQDCDGDSFAASIAGSIRGCVKPKDVGSCTWTTVVPQPETKTNWDCNDGNAAYRPGSDYGFPPANATSFDLDCDGQATMGPDVVAGTKVCPTSIAEQLNAQRPCDVSLVNPQIGCYLWKDNMGMYRRLPQAACPDAPSRVTVIPYGWGDDCYVSSQAGVWPCR